MIFILNDELRASLRTITMDLFFQAFKKFSYHDFFFQQNDATVVQRGLNPLTLMGDQDRISPYNIQQMSDANEEKYQLGIIN